MSALNTNLLLAGLRAHWSLIGEKGRKGYMTTMLALERIKLYLDLTLQILGTVGEGGGRHGGMTGERLQSDNPDSTLSTLH